ncbi:radical SAM protein with 4Fe4S-binding SPASM domain [Lachnotalea glycerini]|uniref:Radical SAM protein n=1 Tax=Lachnotalea glycerini TaxID=1763509 RepID=A0A255I2C3_9FIRM|nr:radical SAM protein [Lachnotalea glycerini]PXV93719.1 radical SAM protein with 4Fe4S-binding SPASM domain [Lachnotalea glycerini]RDY32661.1 radical SAM protein [Lachnotalea glycerini]
MVDYNVKYKFDTEFEILEKNNLYLFVDFNHVNWFRTNKSGYEIIKKVSEGNSIAEALAMLSEEKGFKVDFIEKQFEPFIEEAIKNKVFVKVDKEKTEDASQSFTYPNAIWVHATNICNLNCQFCYSDANAKGIKNIDYHEVLEFLKELPKEHRKKVIISGGEPFLYPNLLPLVSGLKELEFTVNIITNGTVGREIYPDIIPRIDLLQVSVDGTKEEINQKTRGNHSLEKTLESIKYAKELGVKEIYISFTATKYNVCDLPSFPEFLYDNRISHMHVTKLLPVGRGEINKEDLSPNIYKYAEYLEQFKQNLKIVNQKIHYKRECEEIFLEDKEKTKYLTVSFASDRLNNVMYSYKVTGCGSGDATVSINFDGKIYPCTSLNGEEDCIGDIKTDSIEGIIGKGQELARMLCVDQIPLCKSCKFRYFCGGGCRACAKNNDGIMGKDPDCDKYKEEILEYMWTLNLVQKTAD